MGISFSISGIVVDAIIAIVILGNAIYGYKKGLSNILFSFLSLILTFVLVFILYKPVTNLVLEKTDFQERIEAILGEKLSNSLTYDENSDIAIEANGPLASIFEDEINQTIQENKENVLQILKVKLSEKIVRIVVALALFILIRVVLIIVKNYISLITKLPIINVIDGAGGMIFGLIKGFVIIYITLLILSLILPILESNTIYEAINNSKIGSIMFNKNIILNLFKR